MRRAGDYHLNIQERACYWPASGENRPQLLLSRAAGKEKTPSSPEAPKGKNSATLVLVPANCVRASKLRFAHVGRKFAFGRQFAFWPAIRVLPENRVRPAVCVWPGRVSPAKRVSPADLEQCFISKPTSHQQTHLSPANRRPTSRGVPQTPLATAGGCQRENKQALTALRRRRSI